MGYGGPAYGLPPTSRHRDYADDHFRHHPRDPPRDIYDPSSRRDKKYGGLESAAAAKQQRMRAPQPRDSVSSRYTQDPCKVPETGKDEGGVFPCMSCY